MVNRYVTKLEHEVFIDCLPYEWRSGTSDGLLLPIYPPRGIRSSTLFRWLIDFCNKYVSSLWLMLSPWIIRTLTLPSLLASLVPCIFRRYHTPTIYLPQNSHHIYLLWHFHSHSEIYCHATSTASIWWLENSLSYCSTWSYSWHSSCGSAIVHHFSYMLR